MNSVFSAFKSNKITSTNSNNSNTGGSSSKSNKNLLNPDHTNSYENLRHIREIGSSSSNMSTFINCHSDADLDDIGTTSLLINGKRCPTPVQPILTKSFTLVNGENQDHDHHIGIDQTDHATINLLNCNNNSNNILSSTLSSSSAKQSTTTSSSSPATSVSSTTSSSSSSSSTIGINNNLNLNNNNKSDNTIFSCNVNNNCNTSSNSNRLNRPRLSLSGIGNCNLSSNTLPSVHGRGNNTATNGNTNGQNRTRLSTHQRNLSLDFRSMGILLPPVSQVTNTRINLTQHHRNRSLDSALQRIPEVEVSSPNAESENTLCTNSILGTTMCSSKVATTVNVSPQTSNTNPKNTPQSTAVLRSCTLQTGKVSDIDPILINCKETESSKKREDLTSLGSDDSGIICGSEPDQTSLTRIRRSHESLDSGEIDPEEECIEIETQSMDEEYSMLQSDLCFYQLMDKDGKHDDILSDDLINEKIRYRDSNMSKLRLLSEKNAINANQNIMTPAETEDIDDENDSGKKSDEDDEEEDDDDEDENTPTDTEQIITPTQSIEENKTILSTTTTTSATQNKEKDIIFRGFFGATKNAIFRTAQSIIENHEKKNSNKNENLVKSPTEISKKKEFFQSLKSGASKNKNSSSNATTPDSSVVSPEVEIKNITNSISISSIKLCNKENRDSKVKVIPGVAQCLLLKDSTNKESSSNNKDNVNQSDKCASQSGLLRFFESPIFNIHFAIHYLFYSKEPGVLSFIGNKIFSFPNNEVDLYMPQLILMYIQMDELAEVLDPYLVYRCRSSVDFSLKCLWLLEAYNYNHDEYYLSSNNHSSRSNKKIQLSLMKELFSKRDRKNTKTQTTDNNFELLSPIKKTHHRSQSDATGLLMTNTKLYQAPAPIRLCLGDLTTGRAFDNGCLCFESVRGTVNGLLGQKTVCHCGAPKLAAQKEFMKALIDIGKTLTSLPNKTEKNSRLRVLLNLINKNLPARVWLPLHSEIPHHIVRITEEKTAVLNSKDKTPYIIYVEVVEVNDIFSSPVITKLMPTLRHTKSEEHLDINNTALKGNPNARNEPTKRSTNSLGRRTEKISESSSNSNENVNVQSKYDLHELGITEDDVWSQEDDEITAQYLKMHNLNKFNERDAISQMSLESCDSLRDQRDHPMVFNIGDVRTRHCTNLDNESTKSFNRDPEDPSAAALKEPWHEKERQIRETSPYGHLSNWRLLSAIVKCGDDLRQELMATQLLEMFRLIWKEENVDLWVRPYKIVCLSNDSGLIEPILNTVSLHQIKKNSNKSLMDYFIGEYGDPETEQFKSAQKNFMQSCAAYCLISYLLQVKDRHNGNILLHSDGHLIHIDFGFILNISPKNLGFEQSPFKLTPEFVVIMGGPQSELWTEFKHLLLKGLMAARKHMDRVINIVEIMRSSSQLPCFKNGCSGTVSNLRKRFHLNLPEKELEKKVEQLIFDSLNSLSTKLYDGYQYYTNGIL